MYVSEQTSLDVLCILRRMSKNNREATNLLLAALPRDEGERLIAAMDVVTLPFGKVLYEPGQALKHVYFPLDCVVSLLTLAGNHQAVEVAVAGCDSMLGLPLALGSEVSNVRVMVKCGGTAMRLASERFLKELGSSPALQRLLQRYGNTLMTQLMHTATCNRFHTLQQRFARSLLMVRDRAPAVEFSLTQEFLANMLGVRRVGVSAVASALQKRKLISYSRGKIRITSNRGLEAAACACYQTMRSVPA